MLLIILGIWALLSIIVHIPSFPTHWFSFLYNLALVPQWNFFSPSPPKGDFVLLYRDKLDENLLSNWIEIENKNRNHYHSWIWNPNKRNNKGIFDLINELLSISTNIKNSTLKHQRKIEAIIQTMPYLTLLNYIINYKTNPLATQRQFLIVTKTTVGFESVFTSNFHAL